MLTVEFPTLESILTQEPGVDKPGRASKVATCCEARIGVEGPPYRCAFLQTHYESRRTSRRRILGTFRFIGRTAGCDMP